MPGYLERIQKLKQDGTLDTTPRLPIDSNAQGYELNEINELSPGAYGGLPPAQVEAAEALMNRWGVTDPVLRKYNVLSWVRGYYQDRGENQGDHYEAIKREQARLGRILDPQHPP
ncbi:MAG: hypothetical protein O3A93_05355 [Chloroflexi bacterium]|nr:hypothetical protein [Chloroflexota bacterium]